MPYINPSCLRVTHLVCDGRYTFRFQHHLEQQAEELGLCVVLNGEVRDDVCLVRHSLTHSSSCAGRVEPTILTSLRHLLRSCARAAASSSGMPHRRRSLATTSSHLVRGAPRGRVHPAWRGSNSSIARVGWFRGSLSTCPSHLTRF